MNSRIIINLLIAQLTLAIATSAQTPTAEERLQRLETQMQSLNQENLELRRKLGIEGTTNSPPLVKRLTSDLDLTLGGLIQVHGEFGDPGDARWAGNCGNDRIFIRRARIHLLGNLFEDFNFKLQGDFTGSLSAVESIKLSMTDGWINYRRFDWANVKIGQYYPMFGYEKRLNPMKLEVVELSLPALRLDPDRQIGAQVYGGFLDKRLGYALGVFNGNNFNNNFNDNQSFMVVPRLEGTPLKGKWLGRNVTWNLGASSYLSNDKKVTLAPELCPGTNYFAGDRLGLSFDSQFALGPLTVSAEYLLTWFEPDLGEDFLATGWYIQSGYLFLPKWQGVLRYEEYDPSADIDDDRTKSWTFGVNYLLKGTSLMLSLNYLLMDTPLHADLQNKVLVRMQAEF